MTAQRLQNWLKMAREKKFEARVRATGADLNQSANFAQSK
jgi:hypothetical protein